MTGHVIVGHRYQGRINTHSTVEVHSSSGTVVAHAHVINLQGCLRGINYILSDEDVRAGVASVPTAFNTAPVDSHTILATVSLAVINVATAVRTVKARAYVVIS